MVCVDRRGYRRENHGSDSGSNGGSIGGSIAGAIDGSISGASGGALGAIGGAMSHIVVVVALFARGVLVTMCLFALARNARAESGAWSFSSATQSPAIELRGPDGIVRHEGITRRGDDTAAVAIVFNGQRSWLGDTVLDLHEPRDDVYPGAYGMLVRAFGRLDLATSLPPGSELVVISYADDVTTLRPLAPAANMTGSLFGSERDYVRNVGGDAVRGMSGALDALSRSNATRKYLVVLGDGTVTSPDMAERDLSRVRRDAAMLDVEIAVFVVKSPLSEPASPLARVADHVFAHVTEDTIVSGVRETLAKSAYRWTVRFAVEPWMRAVPPSLTIDGAPAPERGREMPPLRR